MSNPLAQDLDHVIAHTGEVWDDLRGRQIFLTGGTGFVGKWLLESMVWANARTGCNVRATVLTRHPERFKDAAPHLAHDPRITLVGGDAASFQTPAGDFEFVIHAATEPYFEPTAERPVSMFDADVSGTRRVLEFARAHHTQRLLFTSSGAVYGRQPAELTHLPENYPGAPPTTDTGAAYGQAKRVSEFLCSLYAKQYGFSAVIARLFAFVGPYLAIDSNFAIGNFIRDVLRGGPIRIAGDGTPYRSYLYAADLAVWLWRLLVKGASAHPYNVGSADDLTIADLAGRVAANTVSSTPVEIARQPVPGAPPARYVPNVNRARAELDLRPLISVEEGIRRTYRWHRRSKAAET